MHSDHYVRTVSHGRGSLARGLRQRDCTEVWNSVFFPLYLPTSTQKLDICASDTLTFFLK